MKKAELMAQIREMKNDLKNCKDSKRATFLMATINLYSKKLGKPAPYPTYTM